MNPLEYGFFISIEGIDQSGKQTQAENLAKLLQEEGYQVLLLSFPDYSTPTGQKIEEYLKGYHEWDAMIYQSLMVINRYEAQQRIQEALMSGKVIIADRYMDSSMAYGMADGLNAQWLFEIQQSLVAPDCTVLVDIPVEEAFRRKGTDRDYYESKKEFLEDVRDIYQQAAVTLKWIILDGTQPVSDITQVLYTEVKTKLEEW